MVPIGRWYDWRLGVFSLRNCVVLASFLLTEKGFKIKFALWFFCLPNWINKNQGIGSQKNLPSSLNRTTIFIIFSFVQPLIVLIEIPIDAAFGLLVLWLCGHTLNLMSCIGIIVSCGIVINDSILKIDAINELRKRGMPVLQAVHTAGQRRLRAIAMTSLTTIGAMVPILFTSDMGSELQQPLAIAMIATMVIGTVVSLFVIPLVYTMVANLGRK